MKHQALTVLIASATSPVASIISCMLPRFRCHIVATPHSACMQAPSDQMAMAQR